MSAMEELLAIHKTHGYKTISCNDIVYRRREKLIGILASGIKKNDPEMIRIAPMVIRKDTTTSLIARRLAWILFQEQFPLTMRWAVHRDPFYKDTDTHLVTDTTRAAIQTYQAAAERRYRGFLRKARTDIKSRSNDPFVSPLVETSSPPRSSPLLQSSSSESSISSHTSSSNPITSRNLRTNRGIIAAAPSSTGFARRRT